MIEASPSERKQWLFETDHLKAQGRLRKSLDPPAHESLACGRIARVRRTDGPRKRLAGIWGTSPALLREDGDSDLTSCVRPGGAVPPDPWGYRPARPSPHRRGSGRAGCFNRRAEPVRDTRVPIEPRARPVPHSALCPVMRRT